MGTFTKTSVATSGRHAVLARVDESSPWVQIESCYQHEDAQVYLDQEGLEHDAEKRAREIANMDGEEWGDDAPKTV